MNRNNFCNASYDDHNLIKLDIPGSTAMATASDPVVILSAARTPLGRFMGELSPFSAHKLGAHVIGAALDDPGHSQAARQGRWGVGDVDLFEINEAFAVVAMAAQKDLGIAREKLNVNGGACALGHPIGATGARLIVTLLHALEAQNLKRGVAALCIGGGEATAIAIERVIHR